MISRSSLPLPLLLIGVAVWLFFAWRSARSQHPAFVFIYLALSTRYISNALHEVMADELIAGQSANALVTLVTVGAGLYLARDLLLRYKANLVIFAFIMVLAISGLWNQQIVGTINSVLRELLSVGIILAIVAALDAEPKDGSFVKRLLPVFFTPLLLQFMSIAFNYPKASEADGSVSWIGGYIHEGVFSIIFLTGMVVTTLASGLSARRRTVLLVVFFVAIFLANYRTTLLAALPILFTHLVIGGSAGFRPNLAGPIRVASLAIAGLLGVALVALLADRMSDIGVALNNFDQLIKPPTDFANAERDLFSGRAYIWSTYVFAVFGSDFAHLMFGFGPESWVNAFQLYAHNVFVSYFYEVGVLGLSAYLFFFGYFAVMAWNTPHPRRWAVLSAHLSFFILAMGTMPTYTIEGIMLYSVIVGFTMYNRLAYRQRTRFIVPANAERLDRRGRRRLATGLKVPAGLPGQA